MLSALRMFAGLLFLATMLPLAVLVLVPLLPWRWTRVRVTNHFGSIMGSVIMWLSGCPLVIEGRDSIPRDRSTIYVGNHTSLYDTFLSIWLSPTGTVGVAKKQIIYYPFFGLIWLLSGHLSIDRSNPLTAIASLDHLARCVKDNRLSVFMWPEGRRSRDGQLQSFKKGIAHLALKTRMPIVPMVIQGAHRAWTKGTLTLKPVPITVTFLPPIETTGWEESRMAEHLEEVRQAFLAVLPVDQRPAVDATVETSGDFVAA